MKTPAPLLFLAALLPATALAQQPTAMCNPTPWHYKVVLSYSIPNAENDPRVQAMIAAARDPSFDPYTHQRMWSPTGVETFGTHMILSYDPIQDPAEISQRLTADTTLAAPFGAIQPHMAGCSSTGPAPVLGIVEYHNSGLNRFYLSANGDEMTWLDSGGGGGGWSRTGQQWTTHAPGQPGCSTPDFSPVYQFYAPGPQRHYYTANPEECGYLRNTSGWTYVGTPFGAKRVPEGAQTCNGVTDAVVPISLFYKASDAGHRYSSNILISESMRVNGWEQYGVQMCVVGQP